MNYTSYFPYPKGYVLRKHEQGKIVHMRVTTEYQAIKIVYKVDFKKSLLEVVDAIRETLHKGNREILRTNEYTKWRVVNINILLTKHFKYLNRAYPYEN